jgi:hypothetical protein
MRELRLTAMLALRRLGLGAPGYVNVQSATLRMVRVLERTPTSEPGGGKENLMLVAASE